mgnify:CR=1 FL=1
MKNCHSSNNYSTNFDWKEASKNEPCPLCEKTDWCYLGFNGSSVEMAFCGRKDGDVGDEWIEFGKDAQGKTKYRRKLPKVEKTYTPPQVREWVYPDADGYDKAKAVRWDYEDKEKEVKRQYCVEAKWVWKLPKDVDDQTFKNEIAPLYWSEIEKAIERGEQVFICEGETTADAVRELGLTATTFIGGKWSECYKDYFKGCNVVLCPDSDETGIKLMDKIAKSLKGVATSIQWLYAYPDSDYLWDSALDRSGGGLDLKDYLQQYPTDAKTLKSQIVDQRCFKVKAETSKADRSQPFSDKPTRLDVKELIEYCEENLSLRYNELTREIEVDGKELSYEPYLYLVKEHNILVGKDKALDVFMMVAKENPFNPVKDYLESLTVAPIDITNLATRYLGTEDQLYNLFVEKMLIGAVARAYEPGCKLDTALVLQGEQGVGKSSFFDVLGGEFFDDSMGNGNDKDELLTLHRSWIQEWGELDRIFGKKAVGQVKSFLAKRRDTLREPYGRKTETFARHSIIVGSVNDSSFLNDPTGDRRFWVIPVGNNKINIPLLKEERDQIWSAAVEAYKAGVSWWLSDEDEKRSSENNKQFQIKDEWQTTIEDYLGLSNRTTVQEILANAFNFSPKDMDKGSQMRVSGIMKAMGWEKKRQLVDGKRHVYWVASDACATPTTPTTPTTSRCATSETPSYQGVATPTTPTTPISVTLKQDDADEEDGKEIQSLKTGVSGVSPVENSDQQGISACATPRSDSGTGVSGVAANNDEEDLSEAEELKLLMLNAQSSERLTALKTEYGFTDEQVEEAWKLMTKEEKKIIHAIAKGS